MNLATPTWTLVSSYPFRQPERVFFNPYNKNELWVSSFGNGMKVGWISTPNSNGNNTSGNKIISSYPNPFNEKLFFSVSGNIRISKVNIYNAQGQLVISEDQPGNFINTGQLKKGMYFLEIITGSNYRVFEKIVKHTAAY
jgi:hypothetical protein